ncbi:uncharacterized protein [Pocillopora verrucosa]|uniref:uncharacterized protein n=1 Tax=Pocillopora verrucosa TaxID=203993 RepID=UPI0033424C6F
MPKSRAEIQKAYRERQKQKEGRDYVERERTRKRKAYIPYGQLKELKSNLPEGHMIVQMDFAENYTCQSVEEVQSAWWNGTMVTLHPAVAYFNDENGSLIHQSTVFISGGQLAQMKYGWTLTRFWESLKSPRLVEGQIATSILMIRQSK